MTGAFSWADLASLGLAAASLAVTIAIFGLGRRLSFRQQRERVRVLESLAWKVLGPIRTKGLNSKVIIMNVARYGRHYDGSNSMTLRGYAYTGQELLDIDHGGVQVTAGHSDTFYDEQGRRTLAKTSNPAPHVIEAGHIPWEWIEDINPDGDEFDGAAIFFVRHEAPGRRPYDYLTYLEGQSVKFGPNNRDYFEPLPELGVRRPRRYRDRWAFLADLRRNKRMEAASRRAWKNATRPTP